MTYDEDDFLPISALQHLMFCPRQCGLIHLEGIWTENRLTAEGRILHEQVHESATNARPGIRIARSLRLHSFRLGLSGQADVVEFYRLRPDKIGGIQLARVSGRWQPLPVEYKRGRPKPDHCDIIQLCAQAMCLEEMLQTSIENGAIHYGRPRRRQEVDVTDDLRRETAELAAHLHDMIKGGRTPAAVYGKKCRACSLVADCLPKVAGVKKNIGMYMAGARTTTGETEE